MEHRTVLLEEAVVALNVKPDGTYVDATYGRGGHSGAILARLGPRGRLVALDRDRDAVAASGGVTDGRFSICHARFGALAEVLAAQGVAEANGVLFDLGVSAPQLEEAERGFSFRLDAPLDMRMDRTQGVTAAEWLAGASEAEIKGVIKTYGEERFAGQIAKAIVAARTRGGIRTTGELARVVGAAVRTREAHQDPATRTFQAVRIHVNQELEELSLALPQALHLLGPGGRLVVISFHSLEDRIVKRRFARGSQGCVCPPDLPVCGCGRTAELRLVGRKPIRPSAVEVERNPRSRSARLRGAERVGP